MDTRSEFWRRTGGKNCDTADFVAECRHLQVTPHVVLGPETMRRADFDVIRRFVRFGEEPETLVTAQRISILVGTEAATTKTHACGLGWLEHSRELIAIVSLFNQITYGCGMCKSESNEWATVSSQHLFDPIKRTIVSLQIV